ncbi:MAG: outer membrane protein assembly factor BamE [Syntrophobacterales bacterium]|jgi:hypothetical protein|nr:outer membrane protein assembly factor BamE [Syntrophobacterales bacterium]
MKKSHLVILLVLGLCALFLVGCSSVNQAKFDKVKTGMTMAQVTAILGEPTESSSVDVGGRSGTASTWKKGDVTIIIQFVNGKVVAKQLSKSSKTF